MKNARRNRLLVCLFIGIAFMFGTLAQEAGADTFNVSGDGDYNTIQGCIDASLDGDICLVGPGIYPENLIITKGITLRSTDGAASTIIDGTNSGRVVHVLGEQNNTLSGAVLDGFTITNGTAPDGLGGGIYIQLAETLIIDCEIMGNSALSGGGIAAYNKADMRIVDSSVTGNTATGKLNSGIELNCIAPIYSFTLEGGGGITIDCSSFGRIARSTISGNSAIGNGGGIRTSVSLVSNNFSFVTGNISLASGGGIASVDTDYIFNTNVVANNSANIGGGIYADVNLMYIVNSTISDNTAAAGGGLYAEPDRTVRIVNTILYGNTSSPVFNLNTCIGYSDIEGGFAGEGNIDFDPSFVDAPNGNYDLNSDSPCIDTGTSDASTCGIVSGLLPEDIEGTPRPQAGYYDMGAYETLCVPTDDREKGKRCRDGIDNDCDNLVDGEDPDCGGPVCTPTEPTESICDDGIDSDCDGATDCADTADCDADPFCQQPDCADHTDKASCDADPDCRWKKKQQVCVNR